jgi:acetyl/propionyl-CoA carboxylase alpha subunit
MALQIYATSEQRPFTAIPVENMRTLLVCRGPIAYETLEVYRRCHWQLPHIVVSAREWIAERQRRAPWLVDMPPHHVHYVQEYDDVEAVLQIAQEHHIDAIYPGYGFLAESAAFAERVQQVGLRFIGPTPETLRAVGNKDAAIALAKRLGMPTIPGDDAVIAFAQTHSRQEIVAETVQRVLALMHRHPGYPIRLKHPAGGGGKGQWVLSVRELQAPEVGETIRDALAKMWAEMGVSAADANASKGVLLELNIPRPLHWEVQLFGDGDTVVHLAARDCSLQNHASQKFIELALCPETITWALQHLDRRRDAARIAALAQRLVTLEWLCTATLRLGQAIRLRGAATVEFLLDEQGKPYFLEVNPRIQVEHAVTESIVRVRGHAISLVELQQRVAAGERLDFRQTDITYVGDAMEVRLNAWHEDLSPVLGGVVHTLRLDVPHALRHRVRVDAGGLLQRREPWLVPSYDANFALIVVSGSQRGETLARMISILGTALQIEGNPALRTNLQPVLGLLTLLQTLPPGAELRTDTSLLWMACTAIVVAQKQMVLSLLPASPRRPSLSDPAGFARLLRATLEAAFTHPSRLLAYYVRRLTDPVPRPLAALEVLGQLAEALAVPLFEEERQPLAVLRAACAALWTALSASSQRYRALVSAAGTGHLEQNADYRALCTSLQALEPHLGPAEATELLRILLGWLSADIPAISALCKIIESSQLHTCLAVNDALCLTRPVFMEDEVGVEHLHRLLSTSLRPAVLRHGELCAPMEATIFLQPEPGAPSFVQIGAEVRVGQILALLEAMKMFTELASPVDGVLLDVLVANGQGVSTGTPLFKIATQAASLDTVDDIIQQIIDTPLQNYFGFVHTPETSGEVGRIRGEAGA